MEPFCFWRVRKVTVLSYQKKKEEKKQVKDKKKEEEGKREGPSTPGRRETEQRDSWVSFDQEKTY